MGLFQAKQSLSLIKINTYDVFNKRILFFLLLYLQPCVFRKIKEYWGESGFQLWPKEKTLQFVSESYLNAKKDIPNKIQFIQQLNIQQIGNYNDLNINMRGEY
jgi:hypothetical protein